MRELANRLEHMGWINRDIRLALVLTRTDGDQMVRLRADFGFEASQLINQLTAKLIIHDQAQLASRLLDAFVAIQQTLTRHQHRWPHRALEQDPERFVGESLVVNAAIVNFLEDSLDALETAARPQREQMQARTPFAPDARVRLTGTG